MNRRERRRARRRNRRLLLLTSALVIGLGGSLGYLGLRLGDRPAGSTEPAITIQPAASANYTPSPGAPIFVLAIGNDERPGVEGARADALHLIGYNPTTKQGTILNFPRDTTVPIPGYGTNKINAANAFGGNQLTAKTVGDLVGVQINYIVEVNFAGFVDLVNELGGVEVDVPKEMKDSNSGSNFNAGLQKLDGEQALAFSRDRYSFADGDFSRTQNQGRVFLGALRKLKTEANSPAGAFTAINAVRKHAKVEGLGAGEFYSLFRVGLAANPDQVKNVLVPVSMGSYEPTPVADTLFADFRDDGTVS
jgi:LCP family protein required for cell wall assembly